MDGRELQSLAAEHPTDEVNGKSKKEDIREALEGEKRVWSAGKPDSSRSAPPVRTVERPSGGV